jgi:hypothetical protein
VNDPQWSESLRAELAAEGIPRRYIDRLMDELADHETDLMEEKTMNACATQSDTVDRRLGQPRELAQAAAVNYRKARFVGRHPWLTFLVTPLPVLILTWIALGYVTMGLYEGLPLLLGDAYRVEGKMLSQWPRVLVWGVYVFDCMLKFVLPAAVVLMFCHLARWSGRTARWAILAGGLVAVFASGVQTALESPATPGQQGRYTVGFGLSLSPHLPELAYVAQFAVPLCIGLAFVFLHRGRHSEAQND